MSAWRCQECRAVLIVNNDDDLMMDVLDHPCEPPLARWSMLIRWLRSRFTR